jgi:hypothetical protein
MPFAQTNEDGKRYDAVLHLVRDGDLFKAVLVTDLEKSLADTVSAEVEHWCSDPDESVLVVSTNVLLNWVEI